MKTYFVYIVKCSDGSYYTGITSDLDERIYQHNEGLDPKAYTYRRRPVELVYVSDFPDVNDAIAFEKQVKGWRRAKKEALISEDTGELSRLSEAYYRKN